MMITRVVISALLSGTFLVSAEHPDRPEKIAFKPLEFQAPRAANFRANLKNGIPVYIHADPQGLPLVRLQVTIRGGAYQEPKGKEGLALLMGSQWRGGGTDRNSATALDERLEFLAGGISTNSGPATSSVSMQILQKDLKEGMELFMQVLTRPAFAEDRLALQRQSIVQGMQARNDAAGTIADYTATLLMNGENHFSNAHPTAASVGSITRDDLKAFHAKLIHPKNMVVTISGRFEKMAMLEVLNQTLGALQPGKDAEVSGKVPAPSFERKAGVFLADKSAPQSVVFFALPGLRRTDPDWHACLVLNEILGGGGFTSRLMKKIRSDEGLTYGINTSFSEGTHWNGDWFGSFSTKNRSVAYSIRLLMDELDRIKRDQVSNEELGTAKESMIQAFPSQWSNKANVINYFASQHLADWPEDLQVTFREKVQLVTADDVQRVARKYLDVKKMLLLVVGPAAEVEAGDTKEHPGVLKDFGSVTRVPLRDPLTFKPLS